MKQYTVCACVLSLLLLGHCSNRGNGERESTEEILHTVLVSVFDSLKAIYPLDSQLLVHLEIIPDGMKRSSIENLIDHYNKNSASDKVEKIALLNELRGIINDSLRIAHNTMTIKNVQLYFYHAKALFDDPKYFGTFCLSNIAYNKPLTTGCFYFALNCGNQCSRGFIIYIKVERGKWVLDDLYQVWG